MTVQSAPWTVVIPVKVLREAKSRIAPRDGSTLALAFLEDVLDAVTASDLVGGVVLATHDPRVEQVGRQRGCSIVWDDEHPGINRAVRWAAQSAVERAGGPANIAVIVSDLPYLTSDAVAAVLSAAPADGSSFVRDRVGTGTTMWLAPAGTTVDPRFGPDSAGAHVRAGAADLAALADAVRIAPARHDVDTESDLADHRGLGQHTRAALADGAA